MSAGAQALVVSVAVVAAVLCSISGAGVLVWSPVLAAAGVFFARCVRAASRHRRFEEELRAQSQPGDLAGVAVRLVPGSGLVAVAGLRHPKIYCDPQAVEALTPVEQTAVALHEEGHRRRRDPARLLVLSAVAPVVGLLPGGRRWNVRRQAELEIAADRYAIRAGAPREAVASALLRLDTPHGGLVSAGFSSAIDLRLAALLDEPAAARRRHRVGWLAVTGVLAACLTLWLQPSHVLVGARCLPSWC